MNEQELDVVREKIAELTIHGTESELRAYIDAQFPRLPENMQNEIMASLFATALEEELSELDAIDQVQEEGLKAVDDLEKLKKEIEAEPEDTA